MTKVCSHGRKRDLAIKMLEDSLRRLQTDHLDLWQIHEVIYDNDPDLHFAPDGAVEALTQAKQQGKVRFVGFTGHKDPAIHLKMLSHRYPFDTVQMPLNPFDKNYRSCQEQVIPEAQRQGIMPIGMKSMGGGGEPVKRGVATPEELLRYAMSVPGILTTVSGIDSYDVFRQNLAIAMDFTPMTSTEMTAFENRLKAKAGGRRLEHYKRTKMYDAAVGREQHGFPSAKELPACSRCFFCWRSLHRMRPHLRKTDERESCACCSRARAEAGARIGRRRPLVRDRRTPRNNAEIDMAEMALKRGSARPFKQ